MTGNSDKIRAVVLAALMVFSVFAGAVAFSGSAAALTTDSLTLDSDGVEDVTTYEYTGTIEAAGDVETIEVTLQNTEMDGASIDSLSIGNTDITVETDNVTTDGDTVTIDVPTTTVASGDGISFTASGVTNPDTVDEYDATITLLAGDDSTVDTGTTTFQIAPGATTESGELLFSGQDVVIPAEEGNSYVLREGTPGGDDTSPVRTLNVEDNFITIDTEDLDTGSYFITGGTYTGEDRFTFEVIEQDFSAEFEDDSIGDDESTTVEFDSNNRAGTFAVNVTADDLDDEELLNIFEDSGVDAEDLATVLDEENEDNNGIRIYDVSDGDEVDADFNGIDTGEYNLTFEVADTGVEDSATIEIVDEADAELGFNESTINEERGDIASINVTFQNDATEGTLVVGDADESGYQATIDVVDDDEDGVVEVLFNTYAAGTENEDAIVQVGNDDDEVELLSQSSDSLSLLEATDDGYQLAVSTDTTGDAESRATETLDNPDELGSLFLQDRGEANMSAWTAPQGLYGDLEEIGDVRQAIEDGELTQTDEVAYDDLAVFQLQAPGASGALQGMSLSELAVTSYDDVDEDGFYFKLEEAGSTPNRDARVVDLESANNAKIVTTDSNQHFVVVDTTNSGLEWADDSSSIDDDTSLEANLTVTSDRWLDDDDSQQSITSDSFDLVDPDAEFDQDPVEVPANEDAAISGTTNIAPGSEITVRVQSTDSEARFIKTNESVVVTPNGTWEALFDFSEDATAGDEFEATVRDIGDNSVTADGTVVEGNGTDNTTTDANVTDTETETTGDTTETDTPIDGETDTATVTESPTDGETDTETGTTGTGTPGFTAVLAVIALIGAGLIALRRDN